MVVVAVADEDGVEVREQFGQDGLGLPADGPDPVAKDGVRQDPKLIDLDEQGRVATAREINGPRGLPGEQSLEFEWSGTQLTAIRGYIGKMKNYERTMQYQGGRLISEEVQGQGKGSRIKYTYANNRLVSAETSNDPAHDNRSRKIAFRSGSPSTVVK